MKSSLRIFLIVFLAGALLFSFVAARDKIERDVLTALFTDEYISALEQYQERYTPSQLIELKAKGRLPSLPVEFKPVPPVTGAGVVEEQAPPLEDDKVAVDTADVLVE